jgi:hypothetical protein
LQANTNCPEGRARQPSETWVCQVTKTVCPIQGVINLRDPAGSLRACNAPERTRHGVERVFTDGAYTGLHHIVGRHLCPLCQHKPQLGGNHHYPFSLIDLTALLNIDRADTWSFREFQIALMVSGISVVRHQDGTASPPVAWDQVRVPSASTRPMMAAGWRRGQARRRRAGLSAGVGSLPGTGFCRRR